LFRDIKIKSQLNAWKIIPASSTKAYCRQHLLEMKVKKATFQRMGSGGKRRTENRWDVSDAGESAPPEVYHISTVSTPRRVSG